MRLGSRVLRVLPGELPEPGSASRRHLSQHPFGFLFLLLLHHRHRAGRHADQDVLEQAHRTRPVRRVRVGRGHLAAGGEQLLVVMLPLQLYHQGPFGCEGERRIVEIAPAAQRRREHGVVEVDVGDAGEHVGPHRNARGPADQAR